MSEPPAPRLENRLPAEDLGGPEEHPLRELAWLLLATLSVLLVLTLLLAWGSRWLAPRVPFSVEQALADKMMPAPAQPTPRQAALQALADRVAEQMALPPGMTLVVSDDPSPLVNAYATVGGRIRVFEGLLARVESEEALAALLAHEIAHVKHRHVAANLGRGLAVALVLGMVSTDAGAAAQGLLGDAAGLALLGYSREQEAEADAEALRAVVALHGHAGGLLALFETLGRQEGAGAGGVELLRTHPLTSSRLQAIEAEATARGHALRGALHPLPEALRVAPRKP